MSHPTSFMSVNGEFHNTVYSEWIRPGSWRVTLFVKLLPNANEQTPEFTRVSDKSKFLQINSCCVSNCFVNLLKPCYCYWYGVFMMESIVLRWKCLNFCPVVDCLDRLSILPLHFSVNCTELFVCESSCVSCMTCICWVFVLCDSHLAGF